jgi:hypothetical protein
MRELTRLGLATLLGFLVSTPSLAVEIVTLSPDVTVDSGAFTTTDAGALQAFAAGAVPLDLGPGLPAGAAVIAIDAVPGGTTLFALDTHVDLDGTVYRPGDVIGWDGAAYSLFWDADADGLPANARVDGLALTPGGDLLLSFDVAVVVRGLTLLDHDVVQLQTGGGAFFAFSDPFDDYGVRAFDVDGVTWLDPERIGLSFDQSGLLGGVAFDDEDVVSFDSNLELFALVYDASVARPELGGSPDVEAITVPEPAQGALLWLGSLVRAILGRRRGRR